MFSLNESPTKTVLQIRMENPQDPTFDPVTRDFEEFEFLRQLQEFANAKPDWNFIPTRDLFRATDMSEEKGSALLKELEARGLVICGEKGGLAITPSGKLLVANRAGSS